MAAAPAAPAGAAAEAAGDDDAALLALCLAGLPDGRTAEGDKTRADLRTGAWSPAEVAVIERVVRLFAGEEGGGARPPLRRAASRVRSHRGLARDNGSARSAARAPSRSLRSFCATGCDGV